MKARVVTSSAAHLVPSALRARAFTLAIWGLSVSAPAFAQNAEISIAADRSELALGDTLTVSVGIDTRGLKLTSAALHVTFDSSVFSIVPEAVTDDGLSVPFAPQSFFSGQIYDNTSTIGDGKTTLSFVTVTGAGLDAERPAVSGQGDVASFRLRTIGFSETGSTSIQLVGNGQGQPVYTVLDQPGRQVRFRMRRGGFDLAIFEHGLLPLADVMLAAGSRKTINLGDYHIAASDEATVQWTVSSSDPHRVEVKVEDGRLELSSSRQAEGTVVIHYLVAESSQKLRGGSFGVALTPAPRLLAHKGISLSEDAVESSHSLSSFLAEGISADADWAWSVTGTSHLNVVVNESDLRITPIRDWSGGDAFILSVLGDEEVLDTLTVFVTVAEVNDDPEIAEISALKIGVGDEVPGPQLAQTVTDPDDAFESLAVVVVGDGEYVQATMIDGELIIRGLSPGTGSVRIDVEDPAGGRTSSTIAVIVEGPSEIAEEVGSSVESDSPLDPPEPEIEPLPDMETPASADPAVDGAAEEIVKVVIDNEPDSNHEPDHDPVPTLETPASPDTEGATEGAAEFPDTGELADDAASEERLRLDDIPELTMPAGGRLSLDLTSYVVSGAVTVWSVTGEGKTILAQIVAGHMLELELLGSGSFGSEVLLITATADDGEVVTEVLRVRFVTEGGDVANSPASDGNGSSQPAPVAVFELISPDPVHIEAGVVESVMSLGDLVRDAGTGREITWSIRGGSHVTAEISDGQLRLDATAAPGGQEVFELEARIGQEVQRIQLVVHVDAPTFEVVSHQAYNIGMGESIIINLDELLVANLSAEFFLWEAEVSEGGQIDLDQSARQLTVTAADADFRVTVTARHAASGLVKTGELAISAAGGVRDADSGDGGGGQL